jgi:hypothetical protein
VTVVYRVFVDTAVATTVTPGTTAPLGSVITPEIEPLMSARAAFAPATRIRTTLEIRIDFIREFIGNPSTCALLHSPSRQFPYGFAFENGSIR